MNKKYIIAYLGHSSFQIGGKNRNVISVAIIKSIELFKSGNKYGGLYNFNTSYTQKGVRKLLVVTVIRVNYS